MSTLYWIAYHTPPLSQHFALTEKSSVNAGLGEGLVGSFPEMYNDPKILLPKRAVQKPIRKLWTHYIAFFEGSLDQPVEAVSSPEFCDLWPSDPRPCSFKAI